MEFQIDGPSKHDFGRRDHGNRQLSRYYEFSEIIELERGEASAYPSQPPAFANTDILPDRWRHHVERVVKREKATLPEARILRYRDARVAGRGAVIIRDGRQIVETLRYAKFIDMGDATDVEISDFTVLLRNPGDANFGHWLIELCTRIPEFRRAYPADDWKVAVPWHPLSMRPLRLHTLEWLGIAEDRVIWIKNAVTRFRDLAFITSNSIHSHTHHAQGIKTLRNAALGSVAFSRKQTRRRLYVGRNTIRRRILNEPDLLAACKPFGLEMVSPETLTIDEQVRLFSTAEIVVGISGAALTNILFAPLDCRILSLNPDHGCEFFFWDVANILGQEFSFIFGPASEPDKLGDSSFVVDPALVSQWLESRTQ